ncbi:MAG TPA: DUF4349 domain-containing protein [Acidimicrobiia bacterium]
MKRLATILALAILVAACSGTADLADDGGQASVSPEGVESRDETGAPADLGAPGGFDVVFEATADRQVIRQASLELWAGDTRATFEEIVILTESVGGFVAQANVHPAAGEDRQPEISMVLRVPAAQLTATMRAIKDAADEVVSETQNAQDVSEQFVDLEARLTNLQALETELRSLLEEVRDHPDADPEKLLRVFTELGSVRGQIEQIQGQINYLSDLTELATIQVAMSQTPAAVPIVEEPWAPAEAAKDAARNLVAALQTMADWVIGFVIYTLPVLLAVLLLPGLILFYAYRKWWKGRDRSPTAAPEPAGS